MPRLDPNQPEESEQHEEPADEAGDVPIDARSLPHGEALTTDEASLIMCARPTRVVAIIGDRDSGKTTLLAELHQAYLAGPVAGHLFAGSETLVAFERRCALGRTSSGSARADTPRTQVADGYRLLHLCVRDTELALPSKDLLLTDISGELMRAALRNKTDAQDLARLAKHSHSLVLMVDGKRLSEQRERHAVRAELLTLLRSFLELGGIHARSRVSIAINKWDWVQGNSPAELASARMLEDAIALCSAAAEARAHQLSLRPRPGVGTTRWLGLSELTKQWLRPDSRVPTRRPALSHNFSRAYLRFEDRGGQRDE